MNKEIAIQAHFDSALRNMLLAKKKQGYRKATVISEQLHEKVVGSYNAYGM